MAATAKLLQLRPKTLPITTTNTTTSTSIHFFSSSSSTTPDPNNTSSSSPTDPNNTPSSQSNPPPPPPQSQSQSQSPFSSYFSDLKASLKQQQQQQQQQRNAQQSQPPRKPLSFSSSISNQPNSPSKIASLEEIRRNLSEFRRRSAPPPPPPSSSSSSSNHQPPHSPQPISFQELYQRNVVSKGEEPGPDASKAAQKLSFEAIRESLRQLKSSPLKNQSQGGGGMNNPMSLSRFKESLMTRPLDASEKSWQQRVFGGSDHLPLSIFGPEINKKEDGDSSVDGKMMMEFLRTYTHKELGKKLRALRPEKQVKKDWFSLEELSDRLVKLREMEEKESDSKLVGFSFQDLRDSLQKLSDEEVGSRKTTMHRLDILGQLGRTPGYMLSPPKEELVEKYFHPDNMSASEKLKLELRKVRDEFKMSESDCGSARVQVAQLTTKIKHLSTALHKKDKHSRKGLEAMVQRRKKLLKYLRRTDWDSYCIVLSKLGLRDNADDNVKKKNYPSQTKDHSPKRKAHKN